METEIRIKEGNNVTKVIVQIGETITYFPNKNKDKIIIKTETK